MILEGPLANILDIQTYDSGSSSWKPWFGHAQTVSFQRGGKRSGATTSVDVGTLAVTLVNAGDPSVDPALKPNLPIRVVRKGAPAVTVEHPAVQTYSQSWDTGTVVAESTLYSQTFSGTLDGWAAGTGDTSVAQSAVPGATAMVVSRSSPGTSDTYATKTLSGFVIGASYTLYADYLNAFGSAAFTDQYVGVVGIGTSTPSTNLTTTPYRHSFTFTATATSLTLRVGGNASASSSSPQWDFVEVKRNAYTSYSTQSWSGSPYPASSVALSPRTGARSLSAEANEVGMVSMNLPGFTAGRSYTLRGWMTGGASEARPFTFFARGGSTTGTSVVKTSGATGAGSHVEVSVTWTATSSTQEIAFHAQRPLGYYFYLDDVSVTENAWTETVTPAGPDVPIFTGRVVDLKTKYALNKSTGDTTTYVTITAADAVSAHANTTRYGAVTAGGIGYETWAQRIIRLSASATTPINPPADDSPIVRYAL